MWCFQSPRPFRPLLPTKENLRIYLLANWQHRQQQQHCSEKFYFIKSSLHDINQSSERATMQTSYSVKTQTTWIRIECWGLSRGEKGFEWESENLGKADTAAYINQMSTNKFMKYTVNQTKETLTTQFSSFSILFSYVFLFFFLSFFHFQNPTWPHDPCPFSFSHIQFQIQIRTTQLIYELRILRFNPPNRRIQTSIHIC